MDATRIDSALSQRPNTANPLPAAAKDALQLVAEVALLAPLLEFMRSVERHIARIADRLDPPPADIVGSRHVAGRLGQTTTWVAAMARDGVIPKGCLVPGTGNGRPWRFYRSRIEEWLSTR